MDDLTRLIARDSDSFNRWEAAQTVGRGLIIDVMKTLASGAEPALPDGYVAALRVVLNEPDLEPAYLAAMLSLPSEGDV
ncbi:MAG: aminopeptidase N C-terminal domain-containing protein, partial [Hyphomicrobiaceae bacterium]